MGYSNIYEFGGMNTWTGDLVTTEEENVTTAKKNTVGNTSEGNDAKDSPTLRFWRWI